MALAGALASAAVVFIASPVPERTRAKGHVAASAALMRGSSLVVSEAALERLPTLRTGDRLRIRVHGAAAATVTLEGRESGGWVHYHQGAVPSDGWLPTGVSVTAGGRTALRVRVCPQGDECREQTYELATEDR